MSINIDELTENIWCLAEILSFDGKPMIQFITISRNDESKRVQLGAKMSIDSLFYHDSLVCP